MNDTKKFNSNTDAKEVRTRLLIAAKKLYSTLWKCSVLDSAIVAMWLFTTVTPFIGNGVLIRNSNSPATITFIFIMCALFPITISVWRILLVIRTDVKRLRVDYIANAPTTIRQIAYLGHHSHLWWWQWLGYVASTLCFFWNAFLLIVWMLVFGFGFLVSLFLIFETLLSTSIILACTSYFYERGVQHNFVDNVTFTFENKDQWARFKAREERRKFRER